MLKGKNAIITGSNKGIGKEILIKFAKNGANVFACCRKRTEEFEKDCAEIARKYSVTIYPIYFDACSSQEMLKAMRKICAVTKDIDILVNNMGTVNSVKSFHMTSVKEMRDEFDVNFFAQMELTQYVSRLMSRKQRGTVVNISSIAGMDGNWGTLQYVSGKSALIAATKRLAIELGRFNIRVNSIAPGLTDTVMAKQMDEGLREEMLDHLVIKRLARPEEIADAVMFFASDMSSYITGQVMRVDGGMLN